MADIEPLAAATARIAELEGELNEHFARDLAQQIENRDAANARIAELESQLKCTVGQREFALDTLNAANARAEAAERVMFEDCAAHENRCHVAEAAQWKAKCEAAERDLEAVNAATDAISKAQAEAEAEAASLRAQLGGKGVCDGHCPQAEALRAEVERLLEQSTTFRVECERLESSLADATALLTRHKRRGAYAEDYRLIEDTEAFLANAPSDARVKADPPPKADARVTTADSAPSTHSTSSGTFEPMPEEPDVDVSDWAVPPRASPGVSGFHPEQR